MTDQAILRAGAAQVEITPEAGVHLAGAVGAYRPAKLVWDPLYAKALVLESGGKRLCILALDVTIVTEPYTRQIRQAARERFGLEPEAVMVHATQTHSAPSLGHFMVDEDFDGVPREHEWLLGGNDRYSEWAAARAVEAIRRALESLQPVQVGSGSGIEGRWAFNRRAVMRDGTISMPGPTWPQPLGPTGIRYIEGPIDPELGVICLRTDRMKMVAVIAHYTCHPVHVFPRPIVSADWPGALSEEIRAAYGPDCVALVLNGACGNINPWPPFDPDYVEDHRRMGRALAQTVFKVIESLAFTDRAALDSRIKEIAIPLRELEPQEMEEAARVLREYPQPVWSDESKTATTWEWVSAASVISVHLMRRRSPNLDYEIQALRIGDIALVGLPGEPFVEGQLRIKMASPAYPTYIAHCTSHYVGYLPTREALRRGGHEANTRYWAKLVPEALDMAVDGAVGVLGEVFG
ncbi:MAG: hypothetical protein IT210_14565 [Armatimonadetes bacterium]|nr:hypothetical protein [Armatimonadota bacterium]